VKRLIDKAIDQFKKSVEMYNYFYGLPEATVILADNLVDYAKRIRKDDQSIEKYRAQIESARVVPPFHNLFIEWRIEVNNHPGITRLGCHIFSYQNPKTEAADFLEHAKLNIEKSGYESWKSSIDRDDRWFNKAVVHMENHGKVTPLVEFDFGLDDNGMLIPETHIDRFYWNKKAFNDETRGKSTITVGQFLDSFDIDMIEVVFATLCFMNTNNTILEERPSVIPEKLQKKRIKRGKHGGVKFHILKVAPMIRTTGPDGKTITRRGPVSEHICRGHWRDYTKGNGLFGKHKGLYWFKESVRGDRDQGQVMKDYDLVP